MCCLLMYISHVSLVRRLPFRPLLFSSQMEVSSKTLDATTENPPPSMSALPQISNEETGIGRTKEGGGDGNFTVSAQEPESMTILQKKFRRAERFGMPVLLSEEEKRMNRAERFGTGPTLQRKSEEQKRKDRAKRFGITVQSAKDEEEKKKARLARFAQVSKLSSVEEEKRNARALRFSQSASTLHSESMSKQAQIK